MSRCPSFPQRWTARRRPIWRALVFCFPDSGSQFSISSSFTNTLQSSDQPGCDAPFRESLTHQHLPGWLKITDDVENFRHRLCEQKRSVR